MSPKTKDYAKRKFYAKFETERIQLAALIQDSRVEFPSKEKYIEKLKALPRNSSLTRVRNRCVITGRGRGVHRFCRLSRIKIRELGAMGWIAGLEKSSW